MADSDGVTQDPQSDLGSKEANQDVRTIQAPVLEEETGGRRTGPPTETVASGTEQGQETLITPEEVEIINRVVKRVCARMWRERRNEGNSTP